MSLPILFRRVARVEFDDAADWYEQRRPGLGPAFIDAVERVLQQLAEQPAFYPVAHRNVREAIVPAYPYCVYYREDAGQLIILSVFHTSRDPAIWQGRS